MNDKDKVKTRINNALIKQWNNKVTHENESKSIKILAFCEWKD